MAEKEERILILTGNKDIYPAWNYSHGPLYLDEGYYDGISRTEAINRMAKAIKENEGEGPKDLAEAALNALLGD